MAACCNPLLRLRRLMTNEGRSLRSQSPGNEPIVRITKQLIRKQEEKMKKISLCTLVALALLVSSAAIAQAGGSPQGTQGSSPGMSQPGDRKSTRLNSSHTVI